MPHTTQPEALGANVGADPYRELCERSADANLIIDGGAFVDCNQATVEMLRCRDKGEILGTHPSRLSPPTQPDGRDSFSKADEMMAIALSQGSHRFEWDHVRRDGEVFPVEVLLTAVPRDGRQILHVVWRDITARKKLEEHLRLTQKMEAIGRMAGGIAHDFNNLLVPILGNAELLADHLHDQETLLEYVDGISSAAGRAATLVRQLLSFARKHEGRPTVVDLGATLRELEKILPRLIGEHHQLVLRLCPEPVKIMVDPGQVEQIIINLVTNARDAMPQRGVLTIEVRQLDVSRSAIGIGVELLAGAYAVLAVSDTGEGMTPEIQRRAFEPFFTTKKVGKGTGLGLATVYGIAKEAGGGTEITSTAQKGTTVRVYLPLTSVPTAPASAAPLAGLKGSETILLVDDEPLVAKLVVGVLRDNGYRVLLAVDGEEALALWRAHQEAIDLVLTDVVMPKMGGIDLARALLTEGYRRPLLFSSGYSDSALSRAADLGSVRDNRLEKPYTATELLMRIREMLARC